VAVTGHTTSKQTRPIRLSDAEAARLIAALEELDERE
jgi:hypothetical protein